MMDIWLIFNLLLPFMEVLLHTYIDYLRNDDDREINHHGTTIKADSTNEKDETDTRITQVLPAPNTTLDLVSRNEKVQVSALKNHYAKLQQEREAKRNLNRLNLCLKFAHVYNPIAAISFVSIYWFFGLKEAEFF